MTDFDRIPMLDPYTVETVFSALSETEDYNHRLMNVQAAWTRTRGAGVRVAVLDTGAPDHVDVRVAGCADFSGSGSARDVNGHGTHVAGAICATAGNGIGVRGIAPDAELYCGKVLDDDGAGSIDAIVRGIRWAVDAVHADVVNLSLGIPPSAPPPRALVQACDYAYAHGVVVCAAAGNDAGAVNHPASIGHVIAVAAVDSCERAADFSCRGREVDFATGGVDVLSTWPGNAYARLSGTSMACPALAGVAALVIADERARTGRRLSPDVVYTRIEAMSKDIGDAGRDDFTGHGLPIFRFEDVDDAAACQPAGDAAPKARGTLSGWVRSLIARVVGYVRGLLGIA